MLRQLTTPMILNYKEQLDKLTEEIAFAELEERDARLDELDIESTVEFAKSVSAMIP